LNQATKVLAFCFILTAASAVFAQQNLSSVPQNVIQLSANGVVEVPQDLLSISMSTTRDGPEANSVQTALKSAVDAALTEAKKSTQSGQLEVRTGNFSLYPRYDRDGKSIGWQGRAELVLEGRDFIRITSTAGRIKTLTLANVSFGLSREQQSRVETEAQGLAIEGFKARASEIAQAFGFTSFTLREVNVSVQNSDFSPRPRLMAMQAKVTNADAPVSVEAGKTSVVVTVSGAVQLK
jgi:predicted secreted protein